MCPVLETYLDPTYVFTTTHWIDKPVTPIKLLRKSKLLQK